MSITEREHPREKLIPIPRTTLAIFTALYLSFPKDIKDVGFGETLKRLGHLSPILIALNEMADLGISAQLKRQSCKQSQFVPLLALENGLRRILETRTETFPAQPGHSNREDKIIKVLVNDFLLLSEHRYHFPPPEWPRLLEIDSGIFEAASVALVFPDKLEEVGIDFPGCSCSNVKGLLAKYGPYLISGTSPESHRGKNQAALKILGLHASEMVLKVRDDEEGRELDKLLGLPNFYRHANWLAEELGKSPEEVLEQIETNYTRLAQVGGLPRPLVWGAKHLAHLTSVLKGQRAFNGSPLLENPHSISRLLDDGYTTTLRHRLDGSSLLAQLFS